MRVLVVVALAAGQDVRELDLPEGASLADALAAAGVAERHPGLPLDRVGVWGRRSEPGRVLREGDRVEVYRPVRACLHSTPVVPPTSCPADDGPRLSARRTSSATGRASPPAAAG